MNAEELAATCLDFSNRTLKQITVNDIANAEKTLTMFMGKDTALRKKFIEENAYLCLDIDV